jgi:hypothetical protein
MPTTLTERSATLTVLDRIKEAMYGLGWKTIEDITQLVGLDGGDEVKQDSVYRALTRNKIEFRTQATATNKAGLWAYGIAITSVRAGNPG